MTDYEIKAKYRSMNMEYMDPNSNHPGRYVENNIKMDMIEMCEAFIGLACTLLFSLGGIKLCEYLFSHKKKLNDGTVTTVTWGRISDDCTSPKRVTRYHSENLIKYDDSNEFTLDEKKICFNFVNTMAFIFILRKHAHICKTMKLYHRMKKTGVFKFEDSFIIKYNTFSDLREADVCNRIKSKGINRQSKIVTAIWYSFFEDKEYKKNSGSSDDDSDTDGSASNPSYRSGSKLDLYDTFDKKNIQVCRRNIRSIEIQPYLKHSVVFHKWYKAACFNPKNHDYIIGSMMLSLARSLKHCHDLGLVHGDIKPDNLLVTYELDEEQTVKNKKEVEDVVCEKSKSQDDDVQTEGQSQEPDSDSILKAHQENEITKTISQWRKMLHLNVTGRTRLPHDIPSLYLIDFGMCGTHEKDEGTGGTRPFCAPETKNIKIPNPHRTNSESTVSSESTSTAAGSDSDTYSWCPLNKQHDIWSWAFILYTVTAYRDVYNRYEDYPADAFDELGYINENQQEYAFEIKTHPFYPVLQKTLCPPSQRTSSIDEVIRDMEEILQKL